MQTIVGIAADEVEAMAEAARDAINLRLSLLPEDGGAGFWTAVSKYYGGGFAEIAAGLCPPVSRGTGAADEGVV
ncbi:hypothetical protein [Methylobacterium durans]|uniref:Uncharacterized protein n=1 Tax=Methylobacterium durans TaxID=2202825 RepID=A0A2U8W7V3_9HYPH|nr:hypothetical protein [Methylobacterium durans]AWN41396.1 hypothetical protein DK389_13835 [Methylobacterium durans]